ncbi:MAG: GntR family transcriptional regulator [Rhodovarius sp.]|nr:GntR family transcriptional regulator [Rhodovarius sp.]MCX8132583.1 GntR family transcriptional regulator [Roseococcus sp.]MDW8314639.1 GntR family transcriptional regulator [Rhodovarius sp.]
MDDPAARAPRGALRPPLREVVREQLERDILSGLLRPGERLVEEELGRRYGVSRSPIREAIRTLASEGLIEVSARRGAVVAGLSPQEAREYVEVRALLEGYNARLAARYRRPEVLARAAAILAEAAAGRGDLAELNARFHDTLAEAGGNATLRAMMESLRKRSARVFPPPADPAAERATWEEHRGILEAILAGDEALAAERAEAHVRKAGAAALAAG